MILEQKIEFVTSFMDTPNEDWVDVMEAVNLQDRYYDANKDPAWSVITREQSEETLDAMIQLIKEVEI